MHKAIWIRLGMVFCDTKGIFWKSKSENLIALTLRIQQLMEMVFTFSNSLAWLTELFEQNSKQKTSNGLKGNSALGKARLMGIVEFRSAEYYQIVTISMLFLVHVNDMLNTLVLLGNLTH